DSCGLYRKEKESGFNEEVYGGTACAALAGTSAVPSGGGSQMKRVARRIGMLFIIFVLGIIGTSVLMNSEITDNRWDMHNPSLPEVMISVDGSLANRMCGYYQKMQGDFMRDSITPIDSSKKLTVVINPYDAKVESLSYEIRTTDGSKVVENKKINN